jgi:hypothetical protein
VKRGDEWWGVGGEYECVDEGGKEGLQLLFSLHTVGFATLKRERGIERGGGGRGRERERERSLLKIK